VLVKTLACGICGSDLHARKHAHRMVELARHFPGRKPMDLTRDVVFGHEFCCEVHLADITHDKLPRCDAILCRDCLVHLSFANIQRAVVNFRASGATWLIATTFPEWQINQDCEDGDWRALNFQRAPFSWGPPVEVLNENCTEAGGGWRDKSLGVWRLSTVVPDK
jgi:hypothetical protein